MGISARHKEALFDAVREALQAHSESETIESYVRHFFWRWYDRQKRHGGDISPLAFYEKIPLECRATLAERMPEFAIAHKQLLKILGEETEIANSEGPQGPSGPPESFGVVQEKSATPPPRTKKKKKR